ncbi:hypothetical protein NX722_05685 [Endozoicomonas gorgoniicola]|uniref:XRE family transcriptional regulator n=1 Tax=Endozoicomonas gorgoniicola TaxID=1234144 RepID=A0ABT3MRY9_9GAMM|nr:hypothetical protein [Endozoicomonas gorgoniicola]MCW7552144.1 hypothetical protein [Endozoicomonas gorgoniicola]
MTPKAFSDALERLGVPKQKEAAAFLRVAQSKVSDYRSGKRTVPGYIEAGLQAHLLLSPEQLATLRQLRGVD